MKGLIVAIAVVSCLSCVASADVAANHRQRQDTVHYRTFQRARRDVLQEGSEEQTVLKVSEDPTTEDESIKKPPTDTNCDVPSQRHRRPQGKASKNTENGEEDVTEGAKCRFSGGKDQGHGKRDRQHHGHQHRRNRTKSKKTSTTTENADGVIAENTNTVVAVENKEEESQVFQGGNFESKRTQPRRKHHRTEGGHHPMEGGNVEGQEKGLSSPRCDSQDGKGSNSDGGNCDIPSSRKKHGSSRHRPHQRKEHKKEEGTTTETEKEDTQQKVESY